MSGYELHHRVRQLDRAIDRPEEYKVCDVCKSLLIVEDRLCRFCEAYRFDSSKKAVVDLAKLLRKKTLEELEELNGFAK